MERIVEHRLDHSNYYKENAAYAAFLTSLPIQGYQKYIDNLFVDGGHVLDVGCGVGSVVHALTVRGSDAYGVDPNATAIEQAHHGPGIFRVSDAYPLPFDDASFDAVGSFTVLEHVMDPVITLREMVRVVKPGGRIVIACPNFLRVVGLSAHHWHTRGTRQKIRNAARLTRKGWDARFKPGRMAFDHMPPIVREDGFEPDDDAITVTNAVDISFFLRPSIRIVYHSGLLTYADPRMDFVAGLPFVRTVIGAVFLVGERVV